MGIQITKNFNVDVIYSRDDEEDLVASDLNYTQMLENITKRITEECEAQMGIVSSHIDGSVTVV